MLRHLVREELLVVVETRDVNECKEAESARLRLILEAHLAVLLLRVDYVDLGVGLLVKSHDIVRHDGLLRGIGLVIAMLLFGGGRS